MAWAIAMAGVTIHKQQGMAWGGRHTSREDGHGNLELTSNSVGT